MTDRETEASQCGGALGSASSLSQSKETKMGTADVMSILGFIIVELNRGHDVTLTITPTADGQPGRLRLPDAWNLAEHNRIVE
jgi:hypothetical protein